jgi:hypothetical protein
VGCLTKTGITNHKYGNVANEAKNPAIRRIYNGKVFLFSNILMNIHKISVSTNTVMKRDLRKDNS